MNREYPGRFFWVAIGVGLIAQWAANLISWDDAPNDRPDLLWFILMAASSVALLVGAISAFRTR